MDYLLADKGYDSDSIIQLPKKRVNLRDFDKVLYKYRSFVERLFQKLKCYRRIATRYERCVTHYASLLSLVSSVIWLQ